MVITNAQTTTFFEDADQMALAADTRAQLVVEGIDEVDDLAEYDKESWVVLAQNLKKPTGRIPNPDHVPALAGADPADVAAANAIPATIPQPPFVFGAKTQKRLLVASEIVRFYLTIGRELTPGGMMWDPVLKNFELQWKALETRMKSNEDQEVPKISKSLVIIKWTEAFDDFLHRKIGTRTIPLAYVTRATAEVPAACPIRANNLPHSTEHGSVEADLVARASHTHPLYRDDNSAVYYHLEEATRTTSYAASIKPFQRLKDGRSAWLALLNQYAGQDKWIAEIKRSEELLHNRHWNGQSNFSLEKFIAQHRNAFVSMTQCAEHVDHQLPNERTRVTYLLDGIKCSDASLQAKMALVQSDDGPNGKMNDFEATASFILPACPVARKRTLSGTKRDSATISDVTGETAEIAGTSGSSKPAVGRTGVELRFYKHAEFQALSKEQVAELTAWRVKRDASKGGDSKKKARFAQGKGRSGGGSGSGGSKREVDQIAAAVAKKLAPKKDKDNDDDEAAIKRYIMSVVAESSGGQATATASSATTKPPPPLTTLKSILKKAKGQG
jgi:hypothetical protein